MMTDEKIFKLLSMPGMTREMCEYFHPEIQKLYNIPIGEISYAIVCGTKTPVLRISFEAQFHNDKNSTNIFRIRYNVYKSNYEIFYGSEKRDFVVKCLRDTLVKKLLDLI